MAGREDGGGAETRRKKELSEDLIVQVLARLPVKSLIRFRCVSKLWYSLILSPHFISIHSTHNSHSYNNKNVATLRLYSWSQRGHETNVSFRIGENRVHELKLACPMEVTIRRVTIVGCFSGVVCISISPLPQKYALWNPATAQVRLIGDPPLNSGCYCSGFCFDPVVNAFKIAQVQLTVSKADRQTRAQVNVFSTATNSWIAKYMPVPFPIGFRIIRGATFVNGYLHWHIVTYHPGQEVEDMRVLSYSIINEAFELIEVPPCDIFVQYSLASYRGSLAIFAVHRCWNVSAEIDLWVMNDCGGSDPTWSKILTFKPSIEAKRVVGFYRKDGVDFILFYSGPNRPLYVCDPVKGETKKFWQREPTVETFQYCESLASLN